jgi:hypothetical protein
VADLLTIAHTHTRCSPGFVWIAVTYAEAGVFEVVKVWQASGKSMKVAFLG